MCLPAFHMNISSDAKILGTRSLCGLPCTWNGLKGSVACIIQVARDFFATMHYESLSDRSAVASYKLK